MDEVKKQRYTEEGYQELLDELKYLEGTATEQNKDALAKARALGDLSENAEYDAAKEEQTRIAYRVLELKSLIENAIVVKESEMNADVINLGSVVRVHDDDEDEDVTYSIVGSNQVDPFENKISDQSPIGRELLGKKVGDIVTVQAPMGSYTLKVLEVSRAKKTQDAQEAK